MVLNTNCELSLFYDKQYPKLMLYDYVEFLDFVVHDMSID